MMTDEERTQILDRVLPFLREIEEGSISLRPTNGIPEEIYAGTVQYEASNGWTLAIFNDCNWWDYIDYILDEDQKLVYEWGLIEEIDAYCPSDEVAWERYQIPGYPQVIIP